MSKLRVNDMAGEFGISADEVITVLRQMDIPVRSHLSTLTDDQVSRVRARWEREKRARSVAPPAPTGTRRRRTTATDAAAEAAAAAAPGIRRRRAADLPESEPEAEPIVEPQEVAEPTPIAAEARPIRHEAPAPVAEPAPAPQASAPAVAAETPAASPAPTVAPPTPVQAAAPVTPPAPKPIPVAAPAAPPRPVAPPATDRPATPPPAASSPAPAAPAAPRPAFTQPPLQPRASATPPRPVTPGAPRPRPIVPGAPRPMGGGSHMPPRPIASATPGGSPAGAGRDSGRSGPSRPNDRQNDRRGGSGGAGGGGGDDRRGGRRGRRVDQEAVSANIFKTMSSMRGSNRKGGAIRREEAVTREDVEAQRRAAVEKERKTVRVNEFVTVSELAQQLKVPATQIVAFAFKNLGLMVTINQRLDFDQIELIAGEFGFQAVREDEYAADTEGLQEVDIAEDLVFRPPVVTIMGHVDHGKTSLLDHIRKANVVAGEAGGITQHIGAYHVSLPNNRNITFLDTPGHQAFTAMRARGAQVTDIVVLVVAADDQVMPQTIEAISHAKNAGVPIVVAINKIDLPGANPMKVKQDLLQHGIVLEEFGGTTLGSEISAKSGLGVPTLLDQILLQAEILDLKANPNRRAVGSVIEAQLDPGKGPVATVLVQSGTLSVGDDFICGMYSGRVRALLDERGRIQKKAGPAIPVQILGIGGVPMAGDQFLVVEDASASREIAQRRQRLDREAKSRRTMKGSVSLEEFMSQAAAGQQRALRIVIKADQGGPAEALADALGQLSTGEVTVEVIHRGVGAITESDILLARASGAIIVGFHVRPDNNARSAAEREGVEIKLYKIIYEAVEDVKLALEGLLRPEEREVVLGEAEVRETFRVSRIGVIAGCSVRSGVINRQGRIRIIRDGVEIYSGTIASLRRFKDDVREVREGFECGIGIENFNDVKIGDVFECYTKEQVARTLESSAAAT
ncbi:MAG TPA: translation initiation factor IF-2 [Gemmatimonadaceae bacterium]|nr:translation initiation factor IF-2 [Gemmatimonadaceae bacterium]